MFHLFWTRPLTSQSVCLTSFLSFKGTATQITPQGKDLYDFPGYKTKAWVKRSRILGEQYNIIRKTVI